MTTFIEDISEAMPYFHRYCFCLLATVAQLQLGYCWAAGMGNDDALPDQILVASEYWLNKSHTDGTGLYFDLMKEIYEPLGIEVKFIIKPFKRARLNVVNHQADVVIGTYSQDYRGNELLLTPQFPIDTERTVAVFPYESDLTWDKIYEKNRQNAPEATKTYRTAWVLGYNYGQHLGIKKMYEVKLLEQGLKMVANNRLDVMIDNLADVKLTMRYNVPEIEPYLKWEVIHKRSVYMAFSNNLQAARLCKIFDQGMERLLKSGRLKQLYDKWGDNYSMVEFLAPNPHQREVFCQAGISAASP